jgi:hypothetical protein
MYVSKASERLILENERSLHDEVMSNMGNLWFGLLPKIPKVSHETTERELPFPRLPSLCSTG